MVVITGNAYKFNQIQEVFPDASQQSIDLMEIQSMNAQEIVHHKLAEARKVVQKGSILVEDTSFIVPSLGGLPGPFVKFFLKSVGCLGIYTMVEGTGVFEAEVVTTVGFLTEDDNQIIVEGRVSGRVISPRGEGHGWTPLFIPTGYDKTYSEMDKEVYKECNMRVIALEKLKEQLLIIE